MGKHSTQLPPCGMPHPENVNIYIDERFCDRPAGHKNEHCTVVNGKKHYW